MSLLEEQQQQQQQEEQQQLYHLDWSSKQGRILTANGRAVEYYTAERGFDYTPEELPHFYLQQGTIGDKLVEWTLSRQQQNVTICGAWSRLLFVGGWEHSTNVDETVYNLQTNSLFIDLRIPKSKSLVLSSTSPPMKLEDLTNEQLRYFARQHVFAGYSHVDHQADIGRPCCTRHHAVDWNFVGISRPRPNKWWIEMEPKTNLAWKEWAFATDDYGKYYYCERWERLDQDDTGIRLAALLRNKDDPTAVEEILVIVGDHYNYIRNRNVPIKRNATYPDATSLVELVDMAIAANDRDTAIAYLGIDAGHGRISNGWTIDCAIQPWKEGTRLVTKGTVVATTNNDDNHVNGLLWKGRSWQVVECSMTAEKLNELFNT